MTLNKLLKFIFPCRHKNATENVKWATRFDKPIVIEYRECPECGKILNCKVSFVEEAPKPATPPQQVVTTTVNVMPTVNMKLDLSEPKKVEPIAPAPIQEPVKLKEEPKVETPKEEPKKEEPSIREADTVEENLEKEPDEGPFSSTPDAPPPAPEKVKTEAEEEIGEDVKDDSMIEGGCFLKESHSSINRRRKALAHRRARAIEQAKKNGNLPADGKIKIKMKKANHIPFLDEPDRAGTEEEYN